MAGKNSTGGSNNVITYFCLLKINTIKQIEIDKKKFFLNNYLCIYIYIFYSLHNKVQVSKIIALN